MFALLIFIYSFLAAFIIGLLLRFGLCIIRKVISLAWWIIRGCFVLLWKVLRWFSVLIASRVRTDRPMQTE